MRSLGSRWFGPHPRLRAWMFAGLLGLCLDVLFSPAPAEAQAEAPPSASKAIPAALSPWVPWVLENAGDAPCPIVSGTRTCIWLTRLSLDATGTGATFSMQVSTDRKIQVALPGSRERWPEDVRVNNKPGVVLELGTTPEIFLEAGNHSITGRFVWTALPESLRIPNNVALLSLRVQGSPVAAPRREQDGQLWLERGKSNVVEEERLSLSVHRMIEDGVPVTVHTRLRLSAAGKAREIVLPQVLLEGTRPIELTANLPVQLTPEGSLRVQVQAGDYELTLRAVAPEPRDKFSTRSLAAPWPEQEIWVFKANDTLRQLELSGAPQIDATRTDLARDWAAYPAYALTSGQSLELETRRRGEPEPAPNNLHLQRTFWLDQDGSGYTVRDQFHGQIHQSFRVDLTAGTLGQAQLNGVDQVISVHNEKSGVEVRSSQLRLNTTLRLEDARASLPAVGYDQDVQSLSATVALPPGFMLLGSHGVDQLRGTWIDNWDLFDFFFVLLISLAVGKLAGYAFVPVALLALTLSHHQADAPALAWVFLLSFAALARVIKTGRALSFARFGFALSLLGMLLVMVPFAVQGVREALYPQLALDRGFSPGSLMMLSAPSAVPEMPEEQDMLTSEPAPMLQAVEEGAAGGSGSGYGRGESAKREDRSLGYDADSGLLGAKSAAPAPRKPNLKSRVAQDVDPSQVVQTGPGVPSWNFQSFQLTWSGPVEKNQTFELLILPPELTRVWSLLSVLLSLALLFVVARSGKSTHSSSGASSPPAQVFGALLLLGSFAIATPAQAQAFPSQELLNELRERLLKADECTPNCLSVPTMHIKVEGARLSLKAQVHAQSVTAYRAPGPLDSFSPDSVRVDGKEALSATRLQDGFLYVRLAPGLHEVELVGPMPRAQSLTLALGSSPHRVSTDAKGYLFDGLNADGYAEGSISLRRDLSQEKDGETHPEEISEALEPWLLVRREIELGIRFRVTTHIERLGPATRSMFVRFPLLPGESVLDGGLTTDQAGVLIEIPSGQASVSFQSELAPVTQLELRADGATSARPWSETWVVRPSALYHVDFEGIAPVTRSSNDIFEPTYRPWPGEKLTVRAHKLAAAAGASVTIDNVDYQLAPGARIEQSTLTVNVRTSHGTNERIFVPEGATLTGCTVDGMPRSAQVKDGAVELHLAPGAHAIVLTLQRANGIDLSYSPGKLKLGRSLSNVSQSVQLPSDRWLLWASGPSWGPAVLFWGYLVVVLLAAFGLARVPLSPLKPHEWVLLGLGLTQVSVIVVLFVVGWLFALAYRERHTAQKPLHFNLIQVALVLLTLIALGCLAAAVHQGLVVQPDMQVAGQDSSNELLRWYTDHTTGHIPEVQVISLPLWIYKGLMLLWALWLAASLLRWLRWGLNAFRSGGGWQASPAKPPRTQAATQNPRVPLEDIERAQAELDAQNQREPKPDGHV